MTKGLDEILSGDEPAQVEKSSATEPVEPASDGQPRGEHGHFAPKEPKEPEPASAAQEPEPPAERPTSTAPPPGVMEERSRRKTAEERAADLERQLAELRGSVTTLTQQRQQQPPPQPVEPPKPVDFWEDPNKFLELALSPIQQQLSETRFQWSKANAIADHGKDAVTTAETAIKEAISRGELDGARVQAQLAQSRDPVGDVVRWHQNSPAVREQVLREKIRAELLAEQGQQPAAPVDPAALSETPAVMPSNLAGARNVGSRSGPAWSGPQPLNDIFDRSRKKAG